MHVATKYKKPIKKVEGQQKVICQNKDCDKMGKHLSVDDFYKSRNAMVQHHPYCKDCVNKMIDVNKFENASSYYVTDLWTGDHTKNTSRIFSVTGIDAYDNVTVRITPV